VKIHKDQNESGSENSELTETYESSEESEEEIDLKEKISLNLVVGNKYFEENRWMLFVYLDDKKKDLTDRVIKSVEYKIQEQTIIIDKQPFILSRISQD
jgi:hypothetical protein